MEWQDAKKTPPKEEGQYLVMREGYRFPQMKFFIDRKFRDYVGREDKKVTYWKEIKEM